MPNCEIEHIRKRPGGCRCRFFGVTTCGHDRFLIARGRARPPFEVGARAGVVLASASRSRYIPDGTNDLS
jgi:hypothetical protein